MAAIFAHVTCSSGGGTDSVLLPVPPSLDNKCAMEDWESVLTESVAVSPGQEQSDLRSAVPEFEFNGGFGVIETLELLQAGNSSPAQGILTRLNQHLSPTGNPFSRAAFYCKEALQLLLHLSAAAHSSPLSLLFKIGAYKSFSEISPLVNFANFTCNQSLLEAVQGFDRIHIVDFDIGYGGQWASLMQELALRNNGAPLLKITALVSPSTYDQLELSLTRENLIHFANEIKMRLEFEITSIHSLSSSWSACLNEAVAVNIPISCLTSHQWSAPFAIGLVKRLSPRIVVSVERGCDKAADLPAADHIIHAVEAYSSLLDSLEAVSAKLNTDCLQKMEKLIRPEMEKVVMSRFGGGEKWQQHWRNVFMNYGLRRRR